WVMNAMSPQEIRDRIMGPNSKFRKRLIAYLEGSHQAELFTGSIESVPGKKPRLVPHKLPRSEYAVAGSTFRSPTQTFPTPPPPLCTNLNCSGNCAACVKLERWNHRYRREVDNLLVRSNVHTHFHSVVDEAAKDKIAHERKGCLTKNGVCRARFPREVFPVSEIDPKGHINVRHVEPMMNAINPVLTFLSRCNTDVTSMLSGTAIKAVVSYVSDYISKLGLKSYQMFASVYHVFDKDTENVGEDVKEREHARHLMRKMVNSMSAKMEIGSPMASMYVLGHPDHYTSHSYVTFPWRSYVLFVRSFWTKHADRMDIDGENEDDEGDSVPIGKQDGKFVGASGVDDYRYRPVVYNNVSLYEWIQCADRKARTKRERAEFDDEILMAKYLRKDWYVAAMQKRQGDNYDNEDTLEADFNDDDEYFEGSIYAVPTSSSLHDDGDVSDWETDDDDETVAAKHAEMNKQRKPARHAFATGHPLFLSHSVSCDFNKVYTVIPNFIGGALPRADKGDRAYYCLAMLTLFKPWRSPADIKDPISTWDQSFKEYDFSDRQRQLLANFNVRYECNDARDDHFATLKKKLAEVQAGFTSHFSRGFMGGKDDFADNLVDCGDDEESDGESDYHNFQDEDKGLRTKRMEAEAKEIKNILQESGWLNACEDHLPVYGHNPVNFPVKTRAIWNKTVKMQRLVLTANKLEDLPPANDTTSNAKVNTGVVVLDADHFNPRTSMTKKQSADVIAKVITDFNLNTEQKRAFLLVANHA
ncbi:hypothetical protein C8R44DRAFT_548657, partial [Mycena epipterygia]